MKTLNLYLSSTDKTAEGKITEQFICEGKKSKNLPILIKNELLITDSDLFIVYLGSSVKECFKATILKESKMNMELKIAINCDKRILLAYSPAWNNTKDKYLFYDTSVKIEQNGTISIEGISGTSLSSSELANYCKEIENKNNSKPCVETCISEKNIEHQFEVHLLLETKTIFNEELLLIN